MSRLSEKIVGLLGTLTEKDESHQQATAEKIESLEKELQGLREKLEEGGGDEKNTQLRNVLDLVKQKMIEQNEVLEQLTAVPLAHAVVLYVDEMENLSLPKNFSPRDVEIGMMVRVLEKNHPFYGKVGKVVNGLDDDGDIKVEVNGDEKYVKIVSERDPDAEPIEIIAGNGDKANSVVVAYEGKRLELRYPQELLQAILERGGNQSQSVSYEGFHIDDRVRIRRDSEFSHQNSGEGAIKSLYEKGWMAVQFDSGGSNNYRIGHPDVDSGACDLELVNPPVVEKQDDGLSEVKFLEPGDIVKLSLDTMQIVAVVDRPRVSGEIAFVRNVIDQYVVEVEYQGSTRVVHNGNGKVETGDRVVLDPTTSIILRNLGKEDGTFSFAQETNVTWDDIGGLNEAKESMIEAIEMPFRYPELYRGYNKKPIKGVLLYGPTGCGKTMIGKATATSLARIHNGANASSGFLYIKGPEILDRFVGAAETTVRQIFQRARKHKEEHGYPAVIFIDEADAILSKRGSGISSDVERTIVPMFLAEMDGLEDSGAFLLLATNLPNNLDTAILRDGRIDRKVRVNRPDLSGASDIFRLYLKNVPLYDGHSADELAEKSAENLYVFGEYGFYKVCLKKSKERPNSTFVFSLRDLCSGAMIAGIVDQASSIALRRDIEGGSVRGISSDDLIEATRRVYRQNFHLNHAEELSEFVHDFRDDVLEIQKLSLSQAQV